VVTQPNGETGVYVLDESNQSHLRSVKVGVTAEDQIQIVEGVAEGERILLSSPDNQAEASELAPAF
jgi:HlyD family secretion protein